MRKIILASGSPRRRELLTQIGWEYTVIPSKKEEILRFTKPEDIVKDLSLQKAQDIAETAAPGTMVIGSDTVVALDGEILGKPHTPDNAVKMLKRLEGRSHQVYTGVSVVIKGAAADGSDEIISFAEETDVHVYPMTDAEIEAYVATGDPLDKAGAYGIQGIFAKHVQGISGCYYNVMGLPIGRLYQELKGWLEV